ncbi:hypothetical protein AB4Z09_23615 [Rhodococcus sp. TAF43]|uniref:hypothetical protein n=1 Tax=unclassified Rhodococcus (in: high G+C Gram-positive bacteria) TaxID=192944 RepID=UPI000E0C80C4|nr:MULTISPECIES: hypothetical protein [unclassified Rhodococcus (in: high G+C Gram-positive bacteria)]QKT09672.1 hypothetical protein HUN07_02055 [Rhodococcus sp. W8901]RDI16943.1 hypothetical protein DEU38_12471 [Rhodococcus sp. AG1013]
MRKYWIVGSIPFILIFLVTWLPQINGPHVWFGSPSLFLWVTLVSSVGVSGVLAYFEYTRKDLDEDGSEA